jgi:type II secretory pathway pseudopilin PulG
MKPSKKVGLIIGIAIFAIVLAVLFTIYSRQAGEREQLENNLWAAQILSAKLTTQKEDLGDQLAQAQSLLDSSRKKFPESVDSIKYGEDLFEIADDCDVELTSLSMSNPSSKKVGAVTYSVSSFSVNVNGDVSDILDFVDALRAGVDFQLPWSAEVTAVRINYADTAGTATISLNIYAYEGE